MTLVSHDRDRKHRIPKARAKMSILNLDKFNRNKRVYPEDVVQNAMKLAETMNLMPVIKCEPGIRRDIINVPIDDIAPSWSIRQVSTHPNK